jgi:peptide/nickel transport system substrate-binding protein
VPGTIQKILDSINPLRRQVIAGIKALPSFRLSTFRKVFSLMGQNEKIWLITLAIIALASFAWSANNVYSGFTKPVPTLGGEYREGMLGQPRLINPLLASTDTDKALVRLIFSGLYKYDAQGQIIPDLAESMPEISENQKQYTVHLRQNAKWHNDKPVTADDVIFTFKTLQDTQYNSPLRSQLQSTLAEKKDDYTVTFSLKDVSGPFIHNLTMPLISKAVWENVPPAEFALSEGNLKAVGSGPYLIRELNKLPDGSVQNIKLESYSNYYTHQPYLDTVRLFFYNNYDEILGDLHGKQIQGFGFVPFDQSFFLDHNNKSLITRDLPLPQYQAVFFNLSNRVLSDRYVRVALLYATDKDAIIKEAYNGNARVIAGPILPEQIPDVDNKSYYHPDEAKKLLDDAGWKVDSSTNIRAKGKTPLEFTITTNDFALNVKAAELLQKQWEALNIKVHLSTVPTKELTETKIRPRQFDALVFAQNVGADPDPFVFWHSSQTKNPGLNLTGFANTAADKLINDARSTTNPEWRSNAYHAFQDLIIQESPAIFLDQSVYVYTVDKNMKGVGLQALFDPAFRFYDLQNWYRSERRVLK